MASIGIMTRKSYPKGRRFETYPRYEKSPGQRPGDFLHECAVAGLWPGLSESAVFYTHALGSKLADLAEEWRERLAGTHEDALARRLVADLSAHPILSAPEVADRYEVTERGARAALERLVEREILTQRSMRKAKRGRPAKVYEAAELFALLDLSPRDLA